MPNRTDSKHSSNLCRGIRGAVIHHNNLKWHKGLRLYANKGLSQRGFGIVGWNDYRDEHSAFHELGKHL
jgi:hypothetical protein